eukprot:m.52089 g.52089  ORF g.52089 m.52089 type:complete len:184 (-) comp13038_c0_seq1:387-938(-)
MVSLSLAAALLSIPHILYAFIWFFPHAWAGIFGKRAVRAFSLIASVLKVVQFSTVVLWFLDHNKDVDLFNISFWQVLVFLVLAGAGQALNGGIYKAIGETGVYYGFKLGYSIGWHEGFPFNVVAHPQYVGSVLSVWACYFLFGWNGPQDAGLLAAWWTMLYALTGFQEHYLDTGAKLPVRHHH